MALKMRRSAEFKRNTMRLSLAVLCFLFVSCLSDPFDSKSERAPTACPGYIANDAGQGLTWPKGDFVVIVTKRSECDAKDTMSELFNVEISAFRGPDGVFFNYNRKIYTTEDTAYFDLNEAVN
ncbi:MAG: hypothetical protein M0P13_10265 [Fibrobacteraceae bacterium]|nr:hypothetical protein [Fibrobacteraceae bacterium]